MGLREITNKEAADTQVITNADCLKELLEAKLEALVWEMNLRLLLDQDLQGHILLVEAAEVTQVSVSERRKPQIQVFKSIREKIKHLLRKVFGRGRTKATERKVKNYGSNSGSV